jgi:hypothetical protein
VTAVKDHVGKQYTVFAHRVSLHGPQYAIAYVAPDGCSKLSG